MALPFPSCAYSVRGFSYFSLPAPWADPTFSGNPERVPGRSPPHPERVDSTPAGPRDFSWADGICPFLFPLPLFPRGPRAGSGSGCPAVQGLPAEPEPVSAFLRHPTERGGSSAVPAAGGAAPHPATPEADVRMAVSSNQSGLIPPGQPFCPRFVPCAPLRAPGFPAGRSVCFSWSPGSISNASVPTGQSQKGDSVTVRLSF